MSSNEITNDPRLGVPSASIMHRLAACAGSQQLIDAVAKFSRAQAHDDAAMASGRRIHEYLSGVTDIGLTDAELVTSAKCIALRQEVVGAFAPDAPHLVEMTERRFFYSIGVKVLFTGQCDYIAIDEFRKRALIIDYKTGRNESVTAADNMQLRTQAVLLYSEMPHLERIDAAIIEPWVTSSVQRVSYNADDLREAAVQLIHIVQESLKKDAKRTPGDHCTYCKALAYCKEAQTYALATLKEDTDIIAKLPRGIDCSKFYKKLLFAEKLISQIKAEYELILEFDPDALPGYTLPDHGAMVNVVARPDQLKEAMEAYLSSAEIDGCATYHLNKLKELFGIKHHLSGRELDDEFDAIVQRSHAVSIRYNKASIRPLTKKERILRFAKESLDGNGFFLSE